MEMDEFDFAVEILNEGGATFDPVAAVEVLDAADGLHLGAVDVAADDAIRLMTFGHGGEGVLVFGDVFYGGLGLEFEIGGERPVAEAEHAAEAVEIQVEIQDPVVDVGPEFFEQMVEMGEAIRLVTVDDEIFFTVGGGVDGLAGEEDAAEAHADKVLDEFVVIAADVDDLGLLAAFAEKFLDERVVVIAPEPAELQFPAVNEVADDVEVFAIHHAEEFEEFGDAGVFGAEMDVGDPDRAANDRLVAIQFKLWLCLGHNSRS